MSTAIAQVRQHPALTAVGALLLAVLAYAVLHAAIQTEGARAAVMNGALASLLTGLATGAGALPVLWMRRPAQAVEDGLLGFAAGVMLAATSFSLLLPALEHGALRFGGQTAAAFLVAAGLALGAAALWAAERATPHVHATQLLAGGAKAARVRQVWLFVLAIALHNLPEGLAVGVAYGAGEDGARSVALGIGIQNMPEGLAVALALTAAGYSRRLGFGVALLSGLAEPLAGLAGAALVSVMQTALPLALAFAAGAMLFVISHEIIPESHRSGHHQAATGGLMAGFIIMLLLDTTLG